MSDFFTWVPELYIWEELSAISPERWGVYAFLFFLAFIKFAVAALTAMADSSLNFVEIFATVGGGALLSVVVYTFFGREINKWIKRYIRKKKPTPFSKKRRAYLFWKKYGLIGAAALAPFLSPMVSVGIAVSFQETPRRIIGFTSVSIILWTVIFGLLREGILDLVAKFS